MGLLKWTVKAAATGGLSTLSPKSGVTKRGQQGRANRQLKKQTRLLEEIARKQ
jgi:hypothetical protein